MRKDIASQYVAFQAVSTSDGSAVTTGTPTVYYTLDGGTQGTSTNTAVHEGNGCWSLALTQAETNGDHAVYTFTLSGAISQSVNVYPVGYDETAANVPANVNSISDDTTAADNLELAFDGTGYGFTNCTMPTVTTLTNTVTLANGAHGGVAATLTLSDYSDFLATGFSTHAAADVWSVATRVLTANTNFNDPTAASIADAVWDEVLTSGTHDVGYSAGQRLRYLILTGSQAQAGAANSITLANTESAEDHIFNQNILSIVGGTGAGQTRLITEYNGTTKVAIVDTVWHVTPDNTSIYEVLPFSSILLADHGIAQGGAAGSLTLAATASSDDASYVGSLAYISSGTGNQQIRLIAAYNGTTKVATVSPDWVTTPDATSVYKVLPVGRVIVDSISETTESDIVDAVWDEPTTGHVTAGTFGEQVKTDVDAILADTDELQTNQGDWATATTVDLNVDQSGVTIGTVNALASSAIADVWETDTLTESYAADGAAPTPAQALYLIQQALTEFAISSTTITVKKLDGSTTAATFTLDDDTSPTSRTRAT